MSKILKTSPKSVSSHKDLVMGCLDDPDDSIRLRALDLLSGITLITRVSDPHFFCGSGSWGYPGEGAGGKGKK